MTLWKKSDFISLKVVSIKTRSVVRFNHLFPVLSIGSCSAPVLFTLYPIYIYKRVNQLKMGASLVWVIWQRNKWQNIGSQTCFYILTYCTVWQQCTTTHLLNLVITLWFESCENHQTVGQKAWFNFYNCSSYSNSVEVITGMNLFYRQIKMMCLLK